MKKSVRSGLCPAEGRRRCCSAGFGRKTPPGTDRRFVRGGVVFCGGGSALRREARAGFDSRQARGHIGPARIEDKHPRGPGVFLRRGAGRWQGWRAPPAAFGWRPATYGRFRSCGTAWGAACCAGPKKPAREGRRRCCSAGFGRKTPPGTDRRFVRGGVAFCRGGSALRREARAGFGGGAAGQRSGVKPAPVSAAGRRVRAPA